MYGWELLTVPADKIREKEFVDAPHVLPRFDPQDPFHDFLRACREGKTDTATNFDYAARLTEFTLLGHLAQHAGPGKKVLWDGPNMKVTNLPGLNQWLKREYRKGWENVHPQGKTPQRRRPEPRAQPQGHEVLRLPRLRPVRCLRQGGDRVGAIVDPEVSLPHRRRRDAGGRRDPEVLG